MNCLKCGEYIPVNYSSCPNCNSPISDHEEKEVDEEEELYSIGNEPIEAEIVDESIEIPNKIDTKTCPFCAEIIKLNAVICRFCKMNLKTGRLVLPSQKKEPEFVDFLKYGCGFILALPFLIFLFIIFLFRGCATLNGL